MNAAVQPQQTTLAEMRTKAPLSDVKVDMFSTQGFALANRVAMAFASSDAVPAQFRAHNLKKVNGAEQWVENPAAVGNCIVAIEVAQSVGMSVTAVMQNSDPIEGKLRWSDRFVVAGVNASRRFTPLRFDVKNLGTATASYKEKTGWDNQARRPTFTDREVTFENLRSIAWALPYGFVMPPGIHTLDQARAAGLPVIEGPPVSMKLAVEEGWYGKSGSKWQTELKHKMLMMRSGRYFGDIHAPDIVMGIGRTTEEEADIIDINPDGTVAGVTTEKLRATRPAPHVEVVASAAEPSPAVDQQTGEIKAAADVPQAQQAALDPQWQPSADEQAAINAREMADAQGRQQPAPQPRARRERAATGGME